MHGTVLRNCNARFSWTKNAIRAYCALLLEFGTNSVQLRERKNGPLAPKRHQIKHLDFLILLLESRRSVVRNHSPRPPQRQFDVHQQSNFRPLVPKARFLPTWIDCGPSPKGSLQMKLRRRLYSRLCWDLIFFATWVAAICRTCNRRRVV